MKFTKSCINALILFLSSCAHSNQIAWEADRPSVSPDGSKLIIGSSGNGGNNLYTVDADGSHLSRMTSGGEAKGWPAISSDARTVAYAVKSATTGGGQIYCMNIDGSNVRRLTKNEFSDVAPSFAPDGAHIVFARAARLRPYSLGGMKWDHWDLWLMNSDGGNLKQLTDETYYSVDAPYFMPGGKEIVFAAETVADLNCGARIFSLKIDEVGGAPKPAEVVIARDPASQWNGDPYPGRNNKMVFVSRPSSGGLFDYEIWIADLTGKLPRQVTSTPFTNRFPVISPDGKFVYFVSNPNWSGIGLGRRQLWRIGINGRDAVKLLDLTNLAP